MNWDIKNYPLSELSLWDENSRFPDSYFSKTEQDLIANLLSDKQFKIKQLAKEIVDEFSLPQLEKLVVLVDDGSGKNIVLEGNRRLTVYKLLADPSLAEDTSLRKYFEGLASKVTISGDYQLECLATKIRDEALTLVARKHSKKNNEIPWGDIERTRFRVRRNSKVKKDIARIGIADIVKTLELPEKEFRSAVLSKGFVSTLYRIVDSKYGREKLGYEVSENGDLVIEDTDEFNKLLKIVVFTVVTKHNLDGTDLNSRTLNSSDLIKSYLDTLKSDDVVTVDERIKKLTVKDIFGNSVVEVTKPKSAARKANVVDNVESNQNTDTSGAVTTEEQTPNAGVNASPPSTAITTPDAGSTDIPSNSEDTEPRKHTRLDKDWITNNLYLEYSGAKRVKKLLFELKSLEYEDNQNIAIVGLRVLLELALYDFLENKGLILIIREAEKQKIITENLSRKAKGRPERQNLPKDWTPSFREMLTYLADETHSLADPQKAKVIAATLKNSQFIDFVDELNLFIHNVNYNPSQADIENIWNKFGVTIFEIVKF